MKWFLSAVVALVAIAAVTHIFLASFETQTNIASIQGSTVVSVAAIQGRMIEQIAANPHTFGGEPQVVVVQSGSDLPGLITMLFLGAIAASLVIGLARAKPREELPLYEPRRRFRPVLYIYREPQPRLPAPANQALITAQRTRREEENRVIIHSA